MALGIVGAYGFATSEGTKESQSVTCLVFSVEVEGMGVLGYFVFALPKNVFYRKQQEG